MDGWLCGPCGRRTTCQGSALVPSGGWIGCCSQAGHPQSSATCSRTRRWSTGSPAPMESWCRTLPSFSSCSVSCKAQVRLAVDTGADCVPISERSGGGTAPLRQEFPRRKRCWETRWQTTGRRSPRTAARTTPRPPQARCRTPLRTGHATRRGLQRTGVTLSCGCSSKARAACRLSSTYARTRAISKTLFSPTLHPLQFETELTTTAMRASVM
jgi:hypothetical protein